MPALFFVRLRAREKKREVLTCKIAPVFEVCRGSDNVNGLVASTRSARSIEFSPRTPDFDDLCEN